MNAGRGADGREEGDDSECRVEQCSQCLQEIVNKSLEDHLQENCSHSVPCKLKHAGCNFEGPRYQMVEHLKSNMLHHLTLISEFVKKEKEKRQKLGKLVKEEKEIREKLGKLVKEEKEIREKLGKLVKEEKEIREKLLGKLVKVTIGVGFIVGAIMLGGLLLGGFLYFNRKQANLEIVKSLEDSVAKNTRCLQLLREEFKKVKLDAQRSWWESFKSRLRS